jgi:regulatory subunit for Cdc7p protein kinase
MPIHEYRAKETSGFDLVEKAQNFGIKIWNTSKLESVLQRCLTPTSSLTSSRVMTAVAPTPTNTASSQRSLTRLLESERLHGATTERDPTQKRHDYRYFSRTSCFVLVEDMRGELATIAALEYPLSKGRTGDWPVLHCHPHARGPFIEFDEKERKRWQRSQKAEKDKALEKEEKLERMQMRREEQKRRQAQARRTGDLRRSVSMNNLHRQAAHLEPALDGLVDLDADYCDNPDSANASGYLASTGTGGYLAASGNSMGITSTTGTTSTAGFRSLQLPASLRGRIQQQVVTSRKFPTGAGAEKRDVGTMGPPASIPERPANALLRKSRSTNTLKLEKHEEGRKPGYCESCRVKFDDFKTVRGILFC